MTSPRSLQHGGICSLVYLVRISAPLVSPRNLEPAGVIDRAYVRARRAPIPGRGGSSDAAVAVHRGADRHRVAPGGGRCAGAGAVDHWAYWNRVTLIFSRPGKPTDNGLIEAFNGTLRRECLSPTLFASIEDAQAVLNTWRADYNNVRPYSSLEHLPPAHFRAASSSTEDRSGRLVSHA